MPHLPIEPGGNDVLSYCDVIGPDTLSGHELTMVLARVGRQDVPRYGMPFALVCGPVTIRVGMVTGREPKWRTEFEELAASIRRLYKRFQSEAWGDEKTAL
ncbi:MAG: hypothetical protein HY814_07935 [Candidatus Riflebacteria bacterium]|nr:hypothetical protein [Candidatus Riflebacteria bacterium]